MSLIEYGCATPAVLKRVSGRTCCGDPVYGSPSVISGRFAAGAARTVAEEGEEIVPSAVFLSATPLRPGDVLTIHGRERTVRAVTPRLSLFGRSDHWEAAL